MLLHNRTIAWTLTFLLSIPLGLLAAGSEESGEVRATRRFSATWVENFRAPSEMARRVEAIALVRAVAVRPGRIVDSDGGMDSLPFEEVEFEVMQGIKGMSEGERIVLERVGGMDAEGNEVIFDADGGPFDMEGVYLLFLRRQRDSSFFLQVNHQARYRVADGRLEAADPGDDIGGFFHRRGLPESLSLIREHLAESEQRSQPGRPRNP